MKKELIPKKETKEVTGKLFYNIIIAVILMIFFISLNYAYKNLSEDIMKNVLKIAPLAVMTVSLAFFEISYKKDSGKLAINGIEFLVLAIYTLLITHVVKTFKIDLSIYLVISSYLFASYYIVKTIILYTNERRKALSSLSDISEITKNEEPIKKEATKKKNTKKSVKNKE